MTSKNQLLQDADRIQFSFSTIKEFELKINEMEREFREKAVLNKEAEKALEIIKEFKEEFESSKTTLAEQVKELKDEIHNIEEISNS